jgi:hypothetical protein
MLNLEKYGFEVASRAPAAERGLAQEVQSALVKAFEGVSIMRTEIASMPAFLIKTSTKAQLVFSWRDHGSAFRIICVGFIKDAHSVDYDLNIKEHVNTQNSMLDEVQTSTLKLIDIVKTKIESVRSNTDATRMLGAMK